MRVVERDFHCGAGKIHDGARVLRRWSSAFRLFGRAPHKLKLELQRGRLPRSTPPQSLAFACGDAPAGEDFLFSGEV
jgi:hypothetical protein